MALAYQRRRRTVGAGSVYRTADGRWRGALVVVDPVTGSRKRRVVSARTAVEAQAKLDELRTVSRPTSSMRTGDWLTHWLGTLEHGDISPSTHRGYVSVARTIRRHIGDIPLDRLTASDVERMTRAVQAEGRSARTAAMARKVLRIALRHAARERLINENVAAIAKAPRVTRYVPRPLTPDEARRLIDGTREEPDGPLWAVLATTGLRLGEAAGLTWADIGPDSLEVRRSLGLDWQRRPTLGRPKSERSERRVPLPGIARDALARHRERQDALRAAAGGAWQDTHGLVFTDPIGRSYPIRRAADRLHEATDRLGLPRCRVHDLRHTAASIMVSAGVPLTTVSRLLGHSTIAITFDTYSTLAESVERAGADAIDRALDGAS